MITDNFKYINSYGIICFKIENCENISNDNVINYVSKNFNLLNQQTNELYIQSNNIFYDKIKILMVRRRHSLNYVQFIRGKYKLLNLQKLFSLMTKSENILLKNNTFDYLWNELWRDTAKNKNYKKEFNYSKKKFYMLKEKNFFNFLDNNNLSNYIEPEWEFPKGKKNNKETPLYCAMREFNEETNININNINIFKNINCIEEKYKGTNNKYYKHIYYMGIVKNDFPFNNIDHISEVGDIKWFNINDAINKIRKYNLIKIDLINYIYKFINNILLKIQ